MKRIKKLRLAALDAEVCHDEFFYRFYKAYGIGKPLTLDGYCEAYERTMQDLTPTISDGELVVGKVRAVFRPDEREEWEQVYLKEAQRVVNLAGGGQDSHMTIDYELVLKKGLLGIAGMIDDYLAVCTEDKREFYTSCRRCLLAVIRHAGNYASLAEKQAADMDDVKRKEELCELARICRKVPAYPADSFYEAVQSVHFITYVLSMNPLRFGPQQFQLGHPDRYLLPYYEKGIADGTLTKERAMLLLDCLAIQINHRVPRSLSSGYMVGGVDEDNRVVANELTEMCMQVIDDIGLVFPSVGFCYTPEMPDRFLKKACQILSHGRSHPAIFNDKVISHGMMSYGVPEREAHSYIHSTCVEITPVASSNVWVASPYVNLAQLLLDTMDREYDSFDAHLEAVYEKIDAEIRENFEFMNDCRRIRAENSMNPLLSCFVNDCLERGLDIERGGARYNWIMPSFVGMANLVDSLYALKKVIYEDQRLTVCGFKEILDSDYAGEEELRLQLLTTLPKYGNDIDEIDAYFGVITEHIIAECKKYTAMHTNGRLIPSVFSFTQHESFGISTGATPDGRPAGFPLSDGSGSCQGRELNGLTASISSSTKWKQDELIGGVAVNMKFSKSSLGTDSVKVMMNLIKVFVGRGGFELQINVIDRKILAAARRHPEKYRDLVVRIGGSSDYFVQLSPQMQEELLMRTEHIL